MKKIFSTQIIKVCLLLLLIVPFLLLAGLTFFAFPQQDDFILPILLNKFGDVGAFKWMYQNNTGRFTSHIISILFERKNFIFDHYYVYPLLMLLLTFTGIYFFIHHISVLLFSRLIGRFEKIFYSFILTYIVLNSLPVASGAVYWFASASNYQPAMIFSIFLYGFLAKYFYTNKSSDFAIILILLFILIGTNETTAFFTSLTSVGIAFLSYREKKISTTKFMLLLFVVGLSFSLMFFGAGIKKRQGLLPDMNIFFSLASLTAFELKTLKDVLSSSLFIFFCADLYNLYLKRTTIQNRVSKPNLPVLLFLLAAKVLSLFIVLFFTRGSIPDRVLNNVAFYDVALLILFVSVLPTFNGLKESGLISFFKKWKFPVYILLIFSTGLVADTFQSYLSGYLYHKVYRERTKIIKKAKAENKRTVTIEPADSSINKILETKHWPYRTKLAAREKPKLLLHPYEHNEKITLHFWLSYYDLDTIKFGNTDIIEPLDNFSNQQQ